MLIAIQLKISTLPPTHGFVSQTDEKVLPCPLPLVFWPRLKKKFNSASYPWFSYPGWWKNSPLLPTLGCVTQADENVIICLVPQGCVPQVDKKSSTPPCTPRWCDPGWWKGSTLRPTLGCVTHACSLFKGWCPWIPHVVWLTGWVPGGGRIRTKNRCYTWLPRRGRG